MMGFNLVVFILVFLTTYLIVGLKPYEPKPEELLSVEKMRSALDMQNQITKQAVALSRVYIQSH
jgi:hypothetical protein